MYFDTYIINLEHRTDRLDYITLVGTYINHTPSIHDNYLKFKS